MSNWNGKAGLVFGLAALIVTATHWGRADVELLFGENEEGDYVLLTTESKNPLKYSLKRCDPKDKCKPIGKKASYTVGEIREKLIKLSDKKAQALPGKPKNMKAADYFADLINAIERPNPDWNTRKFHYTSNGSVDQFIRVIDKNL